MTFFETIFVGAQIHERMTPYNIIIWVWYRVGLRTGVSETNIFRMKKYIFKLKLNFIR